METCAKPNPNTGSQDAGSRAALEEAIGRRARELYDLRGRVEGHDLEDWLQAEAELTGKIEKQEKPSHEKTCVEGTEWPSPPAAPANRKPAFFNVKVDGVLYTVEYDSNRCDSYNPGMLKKGQPLQLRLEDNKLYVKLPNNQELETKVIKKVRQ